MSTSFSISMSRRGSFPSILLPTSRSTLRVTVSTEELIGKVASEDLPPHAMNVKRLFGSLSRPRQPPASLLPTELLSEIFLYATHNTGDLFESLIMPVIVSQVSTRWRNIAISTGALWNTIIVTFPTSHEQLSRAVTWLMRSKSSPLHIFLDFRDPSWDWNLSESSHPFRWQDMEAVLRLLMPHVQRWKRFELLTDTWAPIFTFLSYTRRFESLPVLEYLYLSRCNAYFASKDAIFSPKELKKPVPLFGGTAAVRLRELSFIGVHIDWAGSSLSNLTTLEFRYLAVDVAPSVDEFTDIMTSCPDLCNLTIIGRGPHIASPSPTETTLPTDVGAKAPTKPPPIKLSRLTNFTFGFLDTDYALKLLSFFSFPSLEELSLEGLAELDPLASSILDATPVLQFLTSPNPSPDSSPNPLPLSHVHSLNLTSIYASELTFSRLYDNLHDLKYLGLHKTQSAALRALGLPPLDTSSPPCATLLELECQDMDPATVIELVQARAKASPFESVSFECDHIEAEDRSRLLHQGIKIIHGRYP